MIFLESIRKGYWQADDQTKEAILAAYAESVARHGSGGGIRAGGNKKLEAFVTEHLSAPGKKPLLDAFRKKAAEMTVVTKPARGA